MWGYLHGKIRKYKFKDFFRPHPETHAKAHLISWYGLLVYVLLFIFLQVTLSLFSVIRPGVLGVSSVIDYKRVIELTNQERVKNGLSPLSENTMLNSAAEAKANNMFEENYWAHYSPSGKDPWGFINGAGYKFQFAGENLARNFYSGEDAVTAWMNSRTHKDNILNSKYQDIGIAVVEGVLDGQKTVLIVQEFGTPVGAVVKPTSVPAQPVADSGISRNVQGEEEIVPVRYPAGEQVKIKPQFTSGLMSSLTDPYFLTKVFGMSVLGMLGVLLLVDLLVLRKRAVVRLSSSHLPHLVLIGVSMNYLYGIRPGIII